MPSRPPIRAGRVIAASGEAAWPALAKRASRLGLTDLLISANDAAEAGLIGDVDAIAGALQAPLRAARTAKLRLWLSLRLDALDPHGASVAAGAPFRQPDWSVVDPRAGELAATADFASPDFVTWWATRVVACCKAGLAGLIVERADAIPSATLSALLDAVPTLTILAHLSRLGVALGWRRHERLGLLVDQGTLDLTRDGVWTELAGVTQVAPLILSADGDPALASALGDGWVVSLPREEDVAAEAAIKAAIGTPSATTAARPTGPGLAFSRQANGATLRTVVWADGSVRTASVPAAASVVRTISKSSDGVSKAAAAGRVGIESITPSTDDGRLAAKHTIGTPVVVEADLVCDGHDKLAAIAQWRPADEAAWRNVAMRLVGNDRWRAAFTPEAIGRHQFRLTAWRDAFATYQDELTKKVAAGLDVTLELREGAALVDAAAERVAAAGEVQAALAAASAAADRARLLLSPATTAAMAQADERPRATTGPTMLVDVDRERASFASWYELFPRSMSPEPGRHGTLRDVIGHLPRIAAMGFDILYFPPIHPIGRTHRKGRNNTLTPADDDPGSPYAIGSAEGGHDTLHRELGTLVDFEALRIAAEARGMEIAIDFAIQCSPDHPWLAEHPGWFAWRPDGTIRYAENPPKKYEDIVNVDFYAADAVPGLWIALRDVVLLWAERSVRVFRVDNPHTKPFAFWEWLIDDVRARFPDAIFLAEAFTRPKVMARLGKVGFTQSYTYFTWRNTRAEMEQYLTELQDEPWRDCFRPNFFVNTPDINPPFLQTGGRPAHLIRAALATLLSGNWGMYSGFELCEATPVPGREEYLDSEKYQTRAWDWDRPGNIAAEIARLNTVRRRNPALQSHLGVTFLPSDDPQVMVFERATLDRSNVMICAVSFDPFGTHSPNIELPLYKWSLPDTATLACEDVLRDARFTLTGKWQRVTLTQAAPYLVWRTAPAS